MDHSNDELRRQLRATRTEHRGAMGAWHEVLQRVLHDRTATGDQKADVVLGGLPRRRFLAIGGFSVATAAVLAACGTDESTGIPEAGNLATTTALPPQDVSDVVLLRTASSLEYTAIQAYDTVLGLGLLDAALTEVATLFQDQHRDHAGLMERTTRQLGGEPFRQPNPAFEENVVQPALGIITELDAADQLDAVLRFAHALESVAAGTYLSTVTAFSDAKLRQAAMSIGGVEARHAAVLAGVIPGGAPVPAPAAAPAPEETTTTAAEGEGEAEVTAAPVYQVPGPFGSLAPVTVDLGGTEVQIQLPGPNAFVYEWVE